MTALEFIDTEEYCQQKRLVYFSKSKRQVKNLREYAHKKAMKYFKEKYKQ